MQYTGLNAAQVEAARRQGENRLNEKKKNSTAALFFSQFKDVMILILAAATVVSALMGETAEAITIIAIVLLNAVMGFLQEYKTEKTLSALQALAAPTATVIRDGITQNIPAEQVVCGDIALLRSGDRVPADGALVETEKLTLDESLLTGESTAADKTAGNRVYMGTMVTAGTGVLQVDTVGMQTEMGRIATMMQDTEEEKTPLQKRLQQLGKTVAFGCLFICAGVSMIGWLRGESLLETLLSGISLAVAAIPEGMPAIVTIVLALSVGRILKKGAIIRRLPAVETLGCAGVICSDKTGTITQNRMKLCSLYLDGRVISCEDLSGPQEKRKMPLEKTSFWRCMVLCSDAQLQRVEKQVKIQGSATETALLAGAVRCGIPAEEWLQVYRRINAEPFDSVKKRMTVTVRTPDGTELLLCKGAPDILLRLCGRIEKNGTAVCMTAADRRNIQDALQQMAAQGYRVLAFAENAGAAAEKEMVFLGMAGLQDPPKPQVKSAVRRCRRAGMKPVMITGDYPQTAKAIAQQVGIWSEGDEILTGEEMEKLSDEALEQRCMKTAVYARVTPRHKLRIVKAYQKCGQVVAMTGDAVITQTDTKIRDPLGRTADFFDEGVNGRYPLFLAAENPVFSL